MTKNNSHDAGEVERRRRTLRWMLLGKRDKEREDLSLWGGVSVCVLVCVCKLRYDLVHAIGCGGNPTQRKTGKNKTYEAHTAQTQTQTPTHKTYTSHHNTDIHEVDAAIMWVFFVFRSLLFEFLLCF